MLDDFMEDQRKDIQKRAKYLAFCFGVMTIPMRQWMFYISANYYFLNLGKNKQESADILRVKAFSIWFYTFMDVLKKEKKIMEEIEYLEKNGVKVDLYKKHFSELISLFKGIMSLYTIEEQLFLIDRRLQNTHGYLSQYIKDKISIWIYDKNAGEARRLIYKSNNYNKFMEEFYKEMGQNERNLLTIFLKSGEYEKLMRYYKGYLNYDEHYLALVTNINKEMGIKVTISAQNKFLIAQESGGQFLIIPGDLILKSNH